MTKRHTPVQAAAKTGINGPELWACECSARWSRRSCERDASRQPWKKRNHVSRESARMLNGTPNGIRSAPSVSPPVWTRDRRRGSGGGRRAEVRCRRCDWPRQSRRWRRCSGARWSRDSRPLPRGACARSICARPARVPDWPEWFPQGLWGYGGRSLRERCCAPGTD